MRNWLAADRSRRFRDRALRHVLVRAVELLASFLPNPLPEALLVFVEAVDAFLGKMMGDAPDCDSCGFKTVRNGACYKCLNCGASMGCS